VLANRQQLVRLRPWLGLAAGLVALGVAGCGDGVIADGDPASRHAALIDRADSVESFAGDVFVLDNGQLRNPTGTTAADAPLFNVAGTPLDLTWGQWSAAQATSVASCRHDGSTDATLEFSNLVPGGVYSVFYVTFGPDSRNPACPSQERGLPLLRKVPAFCSAGGASGGAGGARSGASASSPGHDHDDPADHDQGPGNDGREHGSSDRDGDGDVDGHDVALGKRRTLHRHACGGGPDPSSFVADASGRARYRAHVDGCLLEATKLDFMLIYHFDGQTYHPLANRGESVTQGDQCRSSYGADAMRQLVVLQKQPL
jgi:hypothetical protein